MLYEEYFLVAGYLLSFVLFIVVFVLYNKNSMLKKKYEGIDDAEKAAQNILNEANLEKERILHDAFVELDNIKSTIRKIEEDKKIFESEFEEMRNDYKDKKYIYDDLLDKISIAEDKVEYIEMGFGNIDFEFDDV